MGNKGHSVSDGFGGYTHYDEKGHKTGRSEPNMFGGYNEYDAKGHKVGHSDATMFGGYNHYDAKGNKIGHSDPNAFGGYKHYDSKGNKVGSSDPGAFGDYSNNDASGACYIATCVYGSYDCPQVWTLRRFRDYTLAKSLPGRLFVKFYYATSPTIVKHFGRLKLFKACWRKILDKWVLSLHKKGYESTPYDDPKQ